MTRTAHSLLLLALVHSLPSMSWAQASTGAGVTRSVVVRPAAAFPPAPVYGSARPFPTTTALLQGAGGLGAGLFAIGVGAVGVLLLASGRYAAGSDGERSTDLDRLISIVAYPSYVLGSAAGVYWVGGARAHQGRFLPTLLGSALGFGAPGAIVGYHLSDPSRGAENAGAPVGSPPSSARPR